MKRVFAIPVVLLAAACSNLPDSSGSEASEGSARAQSRASDIAKQCVYDYDVLACEGRARPRMSPLPER